MTGNAFDFFAEEFDAQAVFASGGAEFDEKCRRAHGNWPRSKAMSLRVYCKSTSLLEELVAALGAAADAKDGQDHGRVILPAADAVDAGDAGHDYDIAAAREQRAHGGEAEALDLGIDAGIFFDEGIGARDVGLGLVEIEVGDEIFHRVLREKAFELRI